MLLLNPIVCSIPNQSNIIVRYHSNNIIAFCNSIYNFDNRKQHSSFLDSFILILLAFVLNPNEKEFLVESILFPNTTSKNDEFLDEIAVWLNNTISLVSHKLNECQTEDLHLPLKTYKFEHCLDQSTANPHKEKIVALINKINKRIDRFDGTKFIETCLNHGDSEAMHFYCRLEQEVVTEIEEYLILFRTGDFEGLSAAYTPSKQIVLASVIYNINQEACDKLTNDYDTFRTYISWAYKTLDGLTKASLLWIQYHSLQEKHGVIINDSEILRDAEKLKEFIDEQNKLLKKSVNLFEDVTMKLDVEPMFKPEIIEYINRHGPPEGGEFDAEKMAVIMAELGIVCE
jgi:hypothetical protein